MTRHFDAIVIGSGQARPPLVGRLVAAGMKVALVEREHVGGTCVNTGCMPTKALVVVSCYKINSFINKRISAKFDASTREVASSQRRNGECILRDLTCRRPLVITPSTLSVEEADE
jgi:pyruvate/2-oxoglutarate dehydrogenase complex dihydrolipoamide dehydrogenase (E3) component